MNKYEFDIHLISNLDIAILYIFISAIVVFIFLRKHIYSIFDPLFFGMVMGICAYSTVLYLYHFDLISNYYFYSFVLTQILFFVGFVLNKPITKNDFLNNDRIVVNVGVSPAFFIYIFSSILFIITQLIVYYVSGIPLLLESRLEIFSGGSGYGFLNRIIYVTSIISVCFATYRILIVKKKIINHLYDYSIIFFSLLVAVLSGSKAGILLIIFAMFTTLLFSKKLIYNSDAIKKFNKISIILIIISFPIAFFTLYVQLGFENITEILISLLLRFIHSGDIFFMSLPGNTLEYLNTNDNGFKALFRSILGTLRLVERDELPTNLGLQVFWFHYNTDLISGPNARHNIFGLFYYGFFGSLFFSFLVGFIFGFIRNNLYRKLNPNESNMILYTLLVMSVNYIEQDPSGQALDYLFSIFLIYSPIYVVSVILFQLSKKNKKVYNEKNILNTRSI